MVVFIKFIVETCRIRFFLKSYVYCLCLLYLCLLAVVTHPESTCREGKDIDTKGYLGSLSSNATLGP